MLIEHTQKKDGLDISYVNENNQIAVEEIILNNGYYNYVECDESDPNKLDDLKSFKGSAIKSEPSKYFMHHNLNEFFAHDMPNNYPVQHEKFSKLLEPDPFSIDIEVPPTEKYGYSPPDKAQNPIETISITDKNFNTILFIIENPAQPTFSDFDKSYINGLLEESLGAYWGKKNFSYDIRIFKTEIEMINVFLECINEYFHLTIGWNFLGYDWLYIFNRSVNLGIDPRKASPTRKLSKKSISVNKNTRIEIQTPTHRVITDYMSLFKESLIYNNLGSYSLDSIAENILKLNKVSYDGNLRKLYNEDFLKFIAYALIDTILVMLLHEKTNLLSIEFFQSYYTGVPYLKLSQTSISEALVYQELRDDNLFLLESEKTNNPTRKYQGGFVKNPTKKIVGSVMGEDFGALYPNCMITMGLSPEAKIDDINTDTIGKPKYQEDKIKWEKYKAMGYALTPMGRIYDISKDYLYTRIEKKLLKQRKIFKGHMNKTYLDFVPQIKEEIKKREKSNN